MAQGLENLEVIVISHSYRSFVKDSVESLSDHVCRINTLFRHNQLIEFGKYFPIHALSNYLLEYRQDLTNMPNNCKAIVTPVRYIPLESQYHRLGDKHLASVKEVIKKERINFDLIHSHFTWSSGYVGAQLKKEYNVPFVLTAHGFDIYALPFKDAKWRKRIEEILNAADHIITVSNSNLNCITKLDVTSPVSVIPNGFRNDLFNPKDPRECRRILNLPQDKNIILTVGNLVPVKGHKYLIDAMEKIVRGRKDILCIIIGSGELYKSLERQIHSHDIEDFVILAGGKPHDQISTWMNASDLLVLPSISESFGVVQIEAMACGKPIVATRNGGSEEIITSRNFGFLVEPANPDDLAEKIQLALIREWDHEAIVRHVETYTWENIAKKIMDVYENVHPLG